ncbi:hypothetical protein [Streptomyces sp. NPDC059165]|uniref:hypothetical protein n=1 Tax=Streptomyces sp. NPDC059165 TaxID=3346751 RepID=UPI0036C7B394
MNGAPCEELWEEQRGFDLRGTVYDVPRGTSMRAVTARRVDFCAAHEDDRRLDG